MTEGTIAAAVEGATEQYYTPYLLAAGGSATAVGWLVTVAQLVTAFCYLKVPSFVSRIGSRKRAVAWLVILDALSFIPFIIVPFVLKDHIAPVILLIYVISVVPGVAVNPIWASWITDLVPAGLRGRYLGFRSTLGGVSSLAAFIGSGLVLHYFEEEPFVGFAIIFGFATIARLVTFYIYLKMADVPSPVREDAIKFSLPEVVKAVRFSAVGKFMVFSALFYFAMFMASPYYAVFMLEDLHFSYVQFMIVICVEQVARLLIMRFWGDYADRNGNIRVVRLVCMMIPAIPLLWIVSQNFYYLIFVQALAGVAAAGFDLCTPNFIYATAPPGSRIRYVAYFRSLNSVAMALGALLGGYLATILPPVLGYSTLALFILSACVRAVVAWRMLPPVVDIAHKRGTTSNIIYRMKGMLAPDAASNGMGWALLYVPSFKLGGFGKEPAASTRETIIRGRGGEGVTMRAVQALRNRFSGEMKPRELPETIPDTAGKAALHNPAQQKALKAGKFAKLQKETVVNASPTLDPRSVVKGLEKRSRSQREEAAQAEPPANSAKTGGVMGNDWVRKAYHQSMQAGQETQEANASSAGPFQPPVMHRPDLMAKIADRLVPDSRYEAQVPGADAVRQQHILKHMTRQAEEGNKDPGPGPSGPGGILHDPGQWKAYQGKPVSGQERRGEANGMLKPEIRREPLIGKPSSPGGPPGAGNIVDEPGAAGPRLPGLLGNSEAWQKYQARESEVRNGGNPGPGFGSKAGLLGGPSAPKPPKANPGAPGDRKPPPSGPPDGTRRGWQEMDKKQRDGR
jgi:MFS family permease